MAINIKTTNMELTNALREYVNDKLENLDKHTPRDPINIDVELEHQTHHQSGPIFRCEIMYAIPGEKKVLRAESTEEDMYAAIDTCVPKIKQQLDTESDKRTTEVKRGGWKFKEMIRKLWD